VSFGRYVTKTAVENQVASNPINTSVVSVTRTWNDTNKNYLPDCDLGNRFANLECLDMSDPNFGGQNITTRYTDDVLTGFGNRPYNWDMSAEVQQQLTAAISVTAGYYRNWFGNFRATDNLEVTSADFTHYCVTAPFDTRLPSGGGYNVCGLYDVSPAKFNKVNNLVTKASNFGDQTQVNDFFTVGIETRFAKGMRLGGGVDTGRTVTDNCFVVDSPQLLNCHLVTPFNGQTQIKLNGSYPLPYDFVVSGVLLSLSGANITASATVGNDAIMSSLGRNLAACGTRTPCSANATVPLIEPGTQFEGRINRFDLRLSKIVRLTPRIRLQANMDAYNVLNASAIALVNNTYGSQWRQPTSILEGRLLQFGGQLNF